MRKTRFRGIPIAVAVLVTAGSVLWFWSGDGHFPGRYGEIRERILDNLQFGRHFTWATNTDTIRAVRPYVSVADVEVLARMLGDERGAVAVAAAHLLELLGRDGEAALRGAAGDPDFKIGMYAQDALNHIAQCRDPAVLNLDRTVCPAGADPVRPRP